MKKFFLLMTLFLFTFVSIGYSSFLLSDSIIRHDYDKDIEEENYITLNYNDGFTENKKIYFEGDSTSLNIENDSIYNPVDSYNHSFVGWYKTKSGFYEDGSSSKYNGESLSKGTTLYAKYVNNSLSNIKSNITSNLTLVPSSKEERKIIYFSGNSTNVEIETIISSSGEVFINTFDGPYNSSSQGTDTSIKNPYNANILIILDSDLVIEGSMNLSAVLGGSTSSLQALITGSFTALDLNGYTITIRNGGSLNAYGMIFNSQDTGGIIVENGSITTPFLVYGFKGGGLTGYSWANSIAPFNNFLCPYLSCETLFTTNGKLFGETSLYAGGGKHSTTLSLVGNDDSFLIEIQSGFLIRRTTDYVDYINENSNITPITTFFDFLDYNYREKFIFTNDPSQKVENLDASLVLFYKCDRCYISLNSLNLAVIFDVPIIGEFSLNVSMKYVDFPIPSFFDISFYNTDFDFGIALVFMPGSTCYVDSNSNIYFKTIDVGYEKQIFSRVTTLDSYFSSLNYIYTDGNGKVTNYGYLSGSTPSTFLGIRLINSAKPAEITIDGSIFFDFSVEHDFTVSYAFYSIGGRINLSNKAMNTLIENQDKIKLWSSYCNYLFYSPGNYYIQNFGFQNIPLISNEKVYMQIGDDMTIVKCSGYDIKNQIYSFNGKDYFYYYTKRENNLVNGSAIGLMDYTDEPTSSNTINKFDNLKGTFLECEVESFQYNGVDVVYLKYNNEFYIKISGAYIKCNEEPSIDNISSLSCTNEKFNSLSSSYYSVGSTSYFDNVYLNEWRFNF